MKSQSSFNLWLLMVALVLFTTCKKDWDNPFDPFANISPDEWAPKGLEIDDSKKEINSRIVKWSYDGDDRISGFIIERKRDNSDWVEQKRVERDITEWSDNQIIPDNATYHYRVLSYAGDNRSSHREKNFKAEFPAVKNLKAIQASGSDVKFDLTWEYDYSGHHGFIVERRVGGELIKTDTINDPGKRELTVENVFLGKSTYDVAYDAFVFFKAPDERYVKSVSHSESHAAELIKPENLTVEWNEINSIKISWDKQTSSEEKFIIYRSESETKSFDSIGSSTEKIFFDTIFDLNTSYDYKVKAVTGGFESDKSDSVSINVKIPSITDLNVHFENDVKCTLTWNYDWDLREGLDSIAIFRQIDNNGWYSIAGITDLTPEIFTYTDENVFTGNKHNYNVQYKIFSSYKTFKSDTVTESTGTSITAPTELNIARTTITKIELAWNYEAQGADSIIVERSYDENSWHQIGSVVPNTTEFEDTSFDLNTQVYYRIKARAGNYYSDVITYEAIYTDIPPPTSVDLKTTFYNDIEISWEFDFEGHTGFRIEKQEIGGGWVDVDSNVSPDSTSYTHTKQPLYPSDTIEYRIFTLVNGSESPQYKEASISLQLRHEAHGGYVFAIENDIVAFISYPDELVKYVWGCYGDSTGATGTLIGQGYTNTNTIVNDPCSNNTTIAATICDTTTNYGFDDWFLPSKDELNEMYIELKMQNIGNFYSEPYWTSSEINAYEAWTQSFDNGTPYQSSKNYESRVRPIRMAIKPQK
jgi:hypothetical protein